MIRPSNPHISKVTLWGMPFHGLVQNDKLPLPAETLAAVPATPDDYVLAGTLANGTAAFTQEGIQVFVDTFPTIGKRFYLVWELFDNNLRTAGTCRLWQNPATPAVVRSPAEAAEDLQRGHIWRNYALFGGNAAQIARNSAKRLGGSNWVYLASDGSRWQIAITVADSGANPKVMRYQFRKFGQYDYQSALALSAPVNFLNIPNGTPALPSLNLSVRLGGVTKTGHQALLITSDPVDFSTQPPPSSFIINQDAMNYGPCAFVHRLDVTETFSGSVVTGIVVAATELKNRAACQTGVQTITPDTFVTLNNAAGFTYSCLLNRAWNISWIVSAYFTPAEVVEYVTVTYSDAWAGTASSSYGRNDAISVPPCFSGIYTSWNVQENRTHTISIKYSFGATEFEYSSVYSYQRSEIGNPAAANEVSWTSTFDKQWTSDTPFISPSTHSAPNSGAGSGLFCLGQPGYPTEPPSVDAIPATFNYGGMEFYSPSGSSLPTVSTLVPLPIITGEGVSGIVELSKPSSSWLYQYRLLSAYGTEHTLTDAAVTLNLSAPINERIPLFASVQPMTGEFIYAQATPVCYV